MTEGETAVGGASWSPDGKALAFFEAAPAPWQHLGRIFPTPLVAVSQIGRVDVASGARTALTTGPGGSRRRSGCRMDASRTCGPIRRDAADSPGGGVGAATPRLLVRTHSLHGWRQGARGHLHRNAVEPRRQADRLPSCRWKGRRRRYAECSAWTRSSGSFGRGRGPRYSPDGRHIVDTDGSSRISELDLPAEARMFVMNADGSDRRVLFESATGSALGPAWSPRGDRIAFGLGDSRRALRTTGASQIFVIAPDGSGLRRVTPDDEANYHFPDWSPDGTRLVLRVASPRFKGLAILDVDSGRVTPLMPTRRVAWTTWRSGRRRAI